MTNAELELLAKMIASEMSQNNRHVCTAFDPDTINELKSFAQFLKQGKKTAFATFIGAVVLFIVGAAATGVVVAIKQKGISIFKD